MRRASYVLVAAVVIATIVPISLALARVGPKIDLGEGQFLGTYDNAPSSIQDAKGDAKAVYQKAGTDSSPPQVESYHDILGASVIKRGETFFFIINLAGNPNNNQDYETLYRWHIITTSPITNREQQYTILFPNFRHGNSTTDGWYFAVYDETVDTYIVRQTKIYDMPADRVEFQVEDLYIGSPTKFDYWVDVLVRVNATLGGPDYLMDYAPG